MSEHELLLLTSPLRWVCWEAKLWAPIFLSVRLKRFAHGYEMGVSNHRRLYDGWVCGLAKRLRYVTLPEKMMNCSCKVDWEHSLLVFNRVFALYFDYVMNCYLFMGSIWCKFDDKSPMFNFDDVIIINMMLLCPYFCFCRHLSLKACGHVFWFRFSLKGKRGLM